MRQRSLSQSFRSAFAGLFHCMRSQRNFRIHLTAALLVLLSAYILGIRRIEVLILFLSILLVLTLEMINTTFESLIDLVAPDWREKARVAKDVAAAAILLAAIGAVIIGILIFSSYIF